MVNFNNSGNYVSELESCKTKYTILLTSAGGLTGVYLSKHFKKSGLYRIVAIDMSDTTPLNNWVDAFYVVPSVEDKEYIPVLESIVLKEEVDIIIPITSYDINLFSKQKVKDNFPNVKMLLMEDQDNRILSNKRTCYEYLELLGIKSPQVYKSIEEVNFPCILKPMEGSGSKDTVKIENNIDYNYWSEKVHDYFLVEYIGGKEFTVDCLFDNNGKCLGANVRERIKISGGGATVTRNDYSQNINKVIQILENTRKIKGPINFQFKRMDSGECCIFDFNTRFASGGLPLTVESGFDIPNRLIQMILNEQVELWYPQKSNDGLTMVRYYEEFFEYTL
ncbi:ATP-grasp domain-containing protein [Virgibacillus byunsanensis]|uniref:ATP-grasp domain-containing protein n=1 Tax=Virgibacillus byunsanensis TaxID=570945 RepID=A0ABW3LGV3_9BACI